MIRRSLTVLLTAVIVIGVAVGVFAAVVGIATGSFYYEDSTVGDGKITAEVGDQLRFVIEDGGRGTPHTVEIPELGISSGPLGTNKTFVTPVITMPGEYVVFCKPHRKKGHETVLVVTGEALTPTTQQQPTTTEPSTTTSTDPSRTTSTFAGSTTTTHSTTTTQPPADSIPVDTTATNADAVGSAAEATIPVGVTGPNEQTWTRSVRLALVALIPLAAIAITTGLRDRNQDE